MGFTTKRGRPRGEGAKADKPKRVLARHQEVLDFMFAKGIITDEELWAGMHLRWLYTLKFGAPGVSAAEMEHFYGREIKIEDPEWQEAREKEYGEAINKLRELKAHKLVMNITIFNAVPQFMGGLSLKNSGNAAIKHKEFKLFIEGLNMLCKLWGRENSRYNNNNNNK